jgi:DNA ligase-1
MVIEKPILSATITDTAVIKYPVMCSRKYDGIRCFINKEKQALTRNHKLIPNLQIRNTLDELELPRLDGELGVGPPTALNFYNRTSSEVMRFYGEPDWTYYVFDVIDEEPFAQRYESLKRIVTQLSHPRISLVQQTLILNEEELLAYEEESLSYGFEGVIGRSLDGPYKYGRSTVKEGYSWKLKRFSDSEAVIIGFVELYSNQNEAKINLLGRTERSSHKENLVPQNTLGALIVRDLYSGVEFEIGVGFTRQTRLDIWLHRGLWINRYICYKYFPIGMKDKPRLPVYKGPRDDLF